MQINDVTDIEIPLDNHNHKGLLGLPVNARAIVLFAHGSGSSRLSPRNNFIADEIRHRCIGTLLFDLLTEQEDLDPQKRFDIPLLSHRMAQAVQWVKQQPWYDGQSIGLFGASTGAAAALNAAAYLQEDVQAVVSRGGRPDLAGEHELNQVKAPTLLIVGGFDEPVIEMNQMASEKLINTEDKDLVIIPGATHLFEEAGTLEKVAALASGWFSRYLISHQSGVSASAS